MYSIQPYGRKGAYGGSYSSGGVPGSASSLLTGLVSYWRLVDLTDSKGTNTLTNNNSTLFVAKGGGAPANIPATVADFVAASSQSLTASFAFGTGDATLAGWINYDGTAESFNGYVKLGSADPFALGSTGLAIYGDNTGNLNFQIGTTTSSSSTNQAAYTAGWHLLVAIRDTSVSPPRVLSSLDGAALTTAAAAASGTGVDCDRIAIGRIGTAANHFSDDPQSAWGLWNVRLTNTQITNLYNAGAAVDYPFTGIP